MRGLREPVTRHQVDSRTDRHFPGEDGLERDALRRSWGHVSSATDTKSGVSGPILGDSGADGRRVQPLITASNLTWSGILWGFD